MISVKPVISSTSRTDGAVWISLTSSRLRIIFRAFKKTRRPAEEV